MYNVRDAQKLITELAREARQQNKGKAMGMAIGYQIKGRRNRRGVSLVAVSIMMVGLAVLSLALFAMVDSSGRAQKGSREKTNARYVTEAGLAVAVMEMSRGVPLAELNMGSEQNPVAFGDAGYWVNAVDLGGDLFELTATGVENNVGSRLELVIREVIQTDQIWAAFGDEGLTMDSNAQVDSYNSGLGSYDEQEINGDGQSAYALDNGNVGSNQDIMASSNVVIHGDATPGPGGTASITGNAEVSGSTAPAAAVIELPPLELPDIPIITAENFSGGGSGPFESYVPAGSYHFGDVEIRSTELVFVGPSLLVFDSMALLANTDIMIDATEGPVEIYVIGDFTMNSNTLLGPTDYNPANFTLNLLSDNIIDPMVLIDLDEVIFESNAKLFGAIYAPNAYIEINSNFELFGSLVARRVHLDSNSKIHFDEALMESDEESNRVFEAVAWRHTPYSPPHAGGY